MNEPPEETWTNGGALFGSLVLVGFECMIAILVFLAWLAWKYF